MTTIEARDRLVEALPGRVICVTEDVWRNPIQTLPEYIDSVRYSVSVFKADYPRGDMDDCCRGYDGDDLEKLVASVIEAEGGAKRKEEA